MNKFRWLWDNGEWRVGEEYINDEGFPRYWLCGSMYGQGEFDKIGEYIPTPEPIKEKEKEE